MLVSDTVTVKIIPSPLLVKFIGRIYKLPAVCKEQVKE